jgi:hypothetical protein
VATATLLASDFYWDGHNYERHGRNTFLYRTPKGAYFTVTLSRWQGEQDRLEVVAFDDAVALYEGRLSAHAADYAVAFPGVQVVEG